MTDNGFPVVERTCRLQVGLNWSLWVEGEGATWTAARQNLMANCMAKYNQRTCDRVQSALQAMEVRNA